MLCCVCYRYSKLEYIDDLWNAMTYIVDSWHRAIAPVVDVIDK